MTSPLERPDPSGYGAFVVSSSHRIHSSHHYGRERKGSTPDCGGAVTTDPMADPGPPALSGGGDLASVNRGRPRTPHPHRMRFPWPSTRHVRNRIMGKLDRLLRLAAGALDLDVGRDRGERQRGRSAAGTPGRVPADGSAPPADRYTPPAAGRTGVGRGTDADRAAIARYDYLMQTADPHRVEEIHREAFARLNPSQRAQVQERMNVELAPAERPASSSPADLARAAGRTEAGRPGRMRGLLSRVRGGEDDGRGRGGLGGIAGLGAAGAVGGAAVGVLGVVAAGAVASSVAGPLLEQAAGLGVDFDALAQGIDVEAIASGVGFDGLSGVAEGVTGAAEGVVGSAGEAVSGFGETAGEWGQKLGDLGIPGIGDLFGR